MKADKKGGRTGLSYFVDQILLRVTIFDIDCRREVYTVNGESRKSYGIAAYADAGNDGTATVVASVRNIMSDRAKIYSIVDLCNENELAILHLYDVVEDVLWDRPINTGAAGKGN